MPKLLQRIKTLWYISGLALDKEPSLVHKLQEGLGINHATIVEMEEPIDKALRQFK